MSPSQFLDRLCRRHGLALRQAEPLLPLVQLAWTARPAVRRRILEEVEAIVRVLAASQPSAVSGTASDEGDDRLLRQIARLLHRWDVGRAG